MPAPRTVRELVQELLKQPQGAPVLFYVNNTMDLVELDGIGSAHEGVVKAAVEADQLERNDAENAVVLFLYS